MFTQSERDQLHEKIEREFRGRRFARYEAKDEAHTAVEHMIILIPRMAVTPADQWSSESILLAYEGIHRLLPYLDRDQEERLLRLRIRIRDALFERMDGQVPPDMYPKKIIPKLQFEETTFAKDILMTKVKKPLLEHPNPKDEEVRQAGKIDGYYAREDQPRFPLYTPENERGLDGKFDVRGQVFKPDRPGKKVASANEGPDSAWPGKYPSRHEVEKK